MKEKIHFTPIILKYTIFRIEFNPIPILASFLVCPGITIHIGFQETEHFSIFSTLRFNT